MILSDSSIRSAVLHGRLNIDPFSSLYVQPNSYDVHLDKKLLIPKGDLTHDNLIKRGYKATSTIIEPDADTSFLWHEYIIPEQGFILMPGIVALGCTEEVFSFIDLAGKLEGVSSNGRIFLRIHVTAGFFDYGFNGTGTIELKNDGLWPIRLRAGMRIGQMGFEEVEGYVSKKYQGRYQNQINPTPTRESNTR